MPRAIWTGAISFGLVHVPVRLVTAVQDNRVSFNMLQESTGQRIRYKKENDEGEEVASDEIVKGYELDTGEWLIVHDEELDDLEPERSETIEITEFVSIADIDPNYCDKPYYITPDEGARKPYKLLMQAMEEAGKVGIAKFVMHGREHLTALRPLRGMLCLVLMRFAEEIRPTEDLAIGIEDVEVNKGELKVAVQLIDAMTQDFRAEDFQDEYQQRVRELLEAKAEGKEYIVPERKAEEVETENLVDALKKSLEQMQKA